MLWSCQVAYNGDRRLEHISNYDVCSKHTTEPSGSKIDGVGKSITKLKDTDD